MLESDLGKEDELDFLWLEWEQYWKDRRIQTLQFPTKQKILVNGSEAAYQSKHLDTNQ